MSTIYRGDPSKANQGAPLHQLLEFARVHGLHITSGEHIGPDGRAYFAHGGHNTGSLHYVGRAIDVGAHLLDDLAVHSLAFEANAKGINLFDERQPPGNGIWTGPHLHLSISPPGSMEV